MGNATPTSSVAARAICRPWCTDHANGTPPSQPPQPDDQMCRHRLTGPFGEVLVSHTSLDGTLVHFYNTEQEMPLVGAAEQFAYALLAAAAAVRSEGGAR